MSGNLTIVQQMLLIVGHMQTVLESGPRADKQVRSAIHHWELAIQAERVDLEKGASPEPGLNLGGFKDDSLIDGMKYDGFLAEEMRQLAARKAEPYPASQ